MSRSLPPDTNPDEITLGFIPQPRAQRLRNLLDVAGVIPTDGDALVWSESLGSWEPQPRMARLMTTLEDTADADNLTITQTPAYLDLGMLLPYPGRWLVTVTLGILTNTPTMPAPLTVVVDDGTGPAWTQPLDLQMAPSTQHRSFSFILSTDAPDEPISVSVVTTADGDGLFIVSQDADLTRVTAMLVDPA